jgi:hypothetical protein
MVWTAEWRSCCRRSDPPGRAGTAIRRCRRRRRHHHAQRDHLPGHRGAESADGHDAQRTVEAPARLFDLTVPGPVTSWPAGFRASARSPGLLPAWA